MFKTRFLTSACAALAFCLGLGSTPVLADDSALSYAPNGLYEMMTAPPTHSSSVLVINTLTGEPMYQKNAHRLASIASITKLMTAMVVLDSGASLDAPITITEDDIDRLKNSSSRLAVGTTLTRREMLLLTLMSSENRAASALARHHPGGYNTFTAQMNYKALQLGMMHSAFYDPTGLHSGNRATALDLARLIQAAYQYPLIRQFSTTSEYDVWINDTQRLHYRNTNVLVREGEWQIGLSKTGYIREAGRCLVMHATVGNTPVLIVLLAAENSTMRTDDARQLKMWLESNPRTWLTS